MKRGSTGFSEYNMLSVSIKLIVFSIAITGASTAARFMPPDLTMQSLHFCFTQSTSSLSISCGLNEVIVTSQSVCGHSDVMGIDHCPQDNAACRFSIGVPVETCEGSRLCALDAIQVLAECRSLLPPSCGGVSYVHVDYFCLPLSSSYVLSICGPPKNFARSGGFIINDGYPASIGNIEKNCFCSFSHINSSTVPQTSISVDILRADLRGNSNLPPCHEKLTSYSSAFILNSRCNEGLFVDEPLVRRTLTPTGGPHSVAFVRKSYPSVHQGRIFLAFKSSTAVSVRCYEVDYDPSLTQITSFVSPTTTSTSTTSTTQSPIPPTNPITMSTRSLSTTPSLPGGRKDPANATVANIGLIVGILTGVILVILTIVLVICCIRQSKRSTSPKPVKVENGRLSNSQHNQHIHHDQSKLDDGVSTPVNLPLHRVSLHNQGVPPSGRQYSEESESDQNHNAPVSHELPAHISTAEESVKSGHRSRSIRRQSSGSSRSYKVPAPLYAVLEISRPSTPGAKYDDSSSEVSTVRTVMSNYDMAGPFHAEVYLCTGSHSEPMSELGVIDADLYSDNI